jgi:hypothetical protein
MRTRSLAVGICLTVLCGLLLTPAVMARADRQVAPVRWHPQTGLSGPVASTAQATLVRRSDGVSFSLTTTELRPGHAYTVWFVVLNNPAACSATPCNAADILLNAATDAQVTYGAGHISGASDKAGFAGAFQVGPISGWLPGGGLHDPLTAEIQLVLNDHGPVLKGYLPGMIQTYRAGCTDASLPGIFPASARADGTPGPNACQLYQVAVFPGS